MTNQFTIRNIGELNFYTGGSFITMTDNSVIYASYRDYIAAREHYGYPDVTAEELVGYILRNRG